MNNEIVQNLKFETIKIILSEVLRVKQEKINSKSKLFSDLGAESLDILDLKFRLEREFKISIEDGEIISKLGKNITAKEIDELFTAESVLVFVEEKIAEK